MTPRQRVERDPSGLPETISTVAVEHVLHARAGDLPPSTMRGRQPGGAGTSVTDTPPVLAVRHRYVLFLSRFTEGASQFVVNPAGIYEYLPDGSLARRDPDSTHLPALISPQSLNAQVTQA